MAFLFSKKAPHSNSSEEKEKKQFLEPDSIMILHVAAGKLQQLSRLPPHTDLNEWLATNTLGFFSQINVQVGLVSELCTQTSCPHMSAGNHTFDLDTEKKKRPKMHAKQYIDTVMTNIEKQLQDESIFPTKSGFEFQFDFVQTVRKIFRQFFTILAHIYFHHFHEFRRLQLHDGLNTLFLHFVYFVQEFSIIDHKELSLLEDLAERLKHHELSISSRPKSEDLTDTS